MAFWRFRQKIFTPTPLLAPHSEIFYYKSRFFAENAHRNVGVSDTKKYSPIANNPWEFISNVWLKIELEVEM